MSFPPTISLQLLKSGKLNTFLYLFFVFVFSLSFIDLLFKNFQIHNLKKKTTNKKLDINSARENHQHRSCQTIKSVKSINNHQQMTDQHTTATGIISPTTTSSIPEWVSHPYVKTILGSFFAGAGLGIVRGNWQHVPTEDPFGNKVMSSAQVSSILRHSTRVGLYFVTVGLTYTVSRDIFRNMTGERVFAGGLAGVATAFALSIHGIFLYLIDCVEEFDRSHAGCDLTD